MNWKYLNPLFWVEVIATALVVNGAYNLSKRVAKEVNK